MCEEVGKKYLNGSGWEVFSKIFSLCWCSLQSQSWSHTNDLPDDVICNIAIYADNTTLYSTCYQASDLCKQLEFASAHESDLGDTEDLGRKCLADFNAGKTQLFLFDRFNNSRANENEWVFS